MNLSRISFLFLTLFVLGHFFNTPIQAQHRCGSMLQLKHAMAEDPSIIERIAELNEQAANYKPKDGQEEIITIPVVFHILETNGIPQTKVSDDKIYTQLDVLNEAFRLKNKDFDNVREIFKPFAADIEIEFCLAAQTPDGLATTGITRTATNVKKFDIGSNVAKYTADGGKDAWDTKKYLNIWVCADIWDENSGNDDILGYAQFPGGGKKETDGVVLAYNAFGTIEPVLDDYNEGGSAVHELGHWLGLWHIWGDGLGEELSCFHDDEVSDTPESIEANYKCDYKIDQCTNDAFPDMIENYMDYTSDKCTSMFTSGQKNRMRSVFNFNAFRYALASSNGCVSVATAENGAKLEKVISPTGAQNCTCVAPEIEFSNSGTGMLYYVKFRYNVDGGPFSSLFWTGELNSLGKASFTLDTICASGDGTIHELKIICLDPNGLPDFDKNGDTIVKAFATVKPAITTKIVESFEGSFPPASWSVGGTTGFSAGNSGNNSAASASMPNFSYAAAAGTQDELILPEIDLNSFPEASFQFDVAYAQKNAGETPDILEVWVSRCSKYSFEKVWSKSGADLATAPPTTNNFAPSGLQWRKEVIDLNNYVGSRNLVIKFRQTRGQGNNLFIDNVNLQHTVGFETPQIINKPNIYSKLFPNPAQNSAVLQIQNGHQNGSYQVVMYNVSGKQLTSWQIPSSGGSPTIEQTISLQDYYEGVYFVVITNPKGEQAIHKLVKLK